MPYPALVRKDVQQRSIDVEENRTCRHRRIVDLMRSDAGLISPAAAAFGMIRASAASSEQNVPALLHRERLDSAEASKRAIACRALTVSSAGRGDRSYSRIAIATNR
jgi:hypothetical protein